MYALSASCRMSDEPSGRISSRFARDEAGGSNVATFSMRVRSISSVLRPSVDSTRKVPFWANTISPGFPSSGWRSKDFTSW